MCKKELNEEEMEKCLFICSNCWEEQNKTKSWDTERRKKMLELAKELENWRRLSEFRGRFMQGFLEFLKQKFGISWYERVNAEYMEWYNKSGKNADS
jgi:hypothetical protein